MKAGAVSVITPPLVEGPKVVFFIPTPHNFSFAMEMANGGYGIPVTITVVTTWALIALFFLFFNWGLKNLEMIPGKKQAFFETLYDVYNSLVTQMFGKRGKEFVVYISALISFIAISNITSFFPIPGFSTANGQFVISPLLRSPSADINTTLGLALITTFMFIYVAIKENGIKGYVGGLCDPTPVMLPMNIIGELAKPTNISMRLFGNAFAGMVIMGLLYMAAPAVLPAPLHLYFDLFQGLVQSFVFTMLTMVYIQGSMATEN
ncbi:MAG: F0F1 ATP synthase subunit A [Psychrilyobacter sp.]|uniref:F0F1 ATP synthase subunit A n=1 Tax=Psychrilyobacter sp. TaxID=2586924 RepID=UPI003C70E850